MDDPRILILESKGRFIEAAEVHIGRGNLTQALQLLKNSTCEDAIQLAAEIALDNIWKECSFGMPVQEKLRQKGSHARRVLECIQEIPLECLSTSDKDQVCLRY